jgi:hypothetical protein
VQHPEERVASAAVLAVLWIRGAVTSESAHPKKIIDTMPRTFWSHPAMLFRLLQFFHYEVLKRSVLHAQSINAQPFFAENTHPLLSQESETLRGKGVLPSANSYNYQS